jgi:hypothetical protein
VSYAEAIYIIDVAVAVAAAAASANLPSACKVGLAMASAALTAY